MRERVATETPEWERGGAKERGSESEGGERGGIREGGSERKE